MTEPFPARSTAGAGPALADGDVAPDTDPPTGRQPTQDVPEVRRIRLRRWRSLPLALRLVLLVHVLLLAGYVWLYPNYRAPDEPVQVDLIVAAASGDAVPWPAPGTLVTSSGVQAGSAQDNRRIAVRRVLPADLAPRRADRTSYREAGGRNPMGLKNQLVQHPPLYYYLGAGVVALVPGWADLPFDWVVDLLQLLSVLLLAPLPLLVYAVARRVGLSKPAGVAAAAVLLAVPELYHMGSSVNNDDLLILTLAGTTLGTAAVARGDVRFRTAGVLGLVAGLALLTKGLAMFLPLTIGLAYLVAAVRTSLRRAVLPAATAMVVAFGIGGWWWLHNKLAYGRIQPEGVRTVQVNLAVHTTFAQTGRRWLSMFWHSVNFRFWLDPAVTQPPAFLEKVALAASVVVLGGVLLSVATRRPAWADAVLLMLPTICLLGMVANASWSVWRAVLQPAGMQGRYMLGGLPGLAVLAVAGASRLLGRRQNVLPLAVLALAAVMQAVQAWVVLHVYWMPDAGSRPARLVGAVRALLAWAAWPAAVVVAVGLSLLAVGVAAVVVLARDAIRTVDPAPAG